VRARPRARTAEVGGASGPRGRCPMRCQHTRPSSPRTAGRLRDSLLLASGCEESTQIIMGKRLVVFAELWLEVAGRVEKWRGGLGEPCVLPALSVAGARTSPHAPFPLPAHRTGQADCPHPALGQGLRLSPTRRSVCAAPVLPDARPGTGRRRGSVPSPDPVLCAWHTTTDAADDTRADRWLDRRG